MDELINWNYFKTKYNQKEQWAFEQLSYLLFCSELGNKIGLFRYKNQAGIETEPLEKNGKLYGFQSKFYTNSIRDNKKDIIESIENAKNKNKQLDVYYLYVNQELSESSTKDKKKPSYQIEIENAAEKNGLFLQWRVPSYFELQLALPENKYIYDIFFNLTPNEGDLIDEIFKHNEIILKGIQTNIQYETQKIEIKRETEVNNLIQKLNNNRCNVIISGEGGCGKTAIFKEYYNKNKDCIPICVFKANELNVSHTKDIFIFDHSFSLTQFIDAYKGEEYKVFAIDSAERLAEVSNSEIINDLIQILVENNWNIVFITRYSYLNDLVFLINETYHLSFENMDIPLINKDILLSLSQLYNFSLPNNSNFTERLKNLFYLKEYLQHYSDIDKQGNYRNFIDILWRKRIQASDQKNNIHLEREKCIIEIAQRRSNRGLFYINADDLPQQALFKLKQDELLFYDDTHNGYFFAHDIYEEWALNKIVSRCYANYINAEEFFNQLGNSLPIRRAYRMWLSDRLQDNCDEIESYINDAFSSIDVPRFWKDELLISILLSDYSDSFFKSYEKEIVADNYDLLLRMLFLLNIACTEVSFNNGIELFSPKGSGWKAIISFIYAKLPDFFQNNLKSVLPILSKWCNFNKTGIITKYAGLLVLNLIKQIEESDYPIYCVEKIKKKLFPVVFNSAEELKTELSSIFNNVIANKWVETNAPYYDFCSEILLKPYNALVLINILPEYVIKLCDLFWKRLPTSKEYDWYSMEQKYGLTNKYEIKYFPSSAYQTPIYWLLKCSPGNTIDFIINFTNEAVETYSKSDYGKEDVEEIKLYIRDSVITQYISNAIWCMYRGSSSPVVPDLLQSIHMALEKYLMEITTTNTFNDEKIERILQYILANSKSASLTSVICSIVLFAPNKFYETAMILFKTIDLFYYDKIRCSNELISQLTTSMNLPKNKFYVEERQNTQKDKQRTYSLDVLFIQYQYVGVYGFSEKQNSDLIHKLYDIIDNFKIYSKNNGKYESLIAQIDRRNLTTNIISEKDNGFIVKLSPKKISKKQKKESEEKKKQNDEMFKYSNLRIWSDFLTNADVSDNPDCLKYENDPLLALQETKQLIKDLELGQRNVLMMENVIPAYTCSKLLIYHKEKLKKNDLDFCKKIILSTISQLFSDKYIYQIDDGVAAAVCAIPSIIIESQDDADDLIMAMVLLLYENKICDYVIRSVHMTSLWNLYPIIANMVLFNYIKLYPTYHRVYTNLLEERGASRMISNTMVINELDKEMPNYSIDYNSIKDSDIESLDIEAIEIVYRLIPSETKDTTLCNIIYKTLPAILPVLLKDNEDKSKNINSHKDLYLTKCNIQQSISYFLLQRDIKELDAYLKPISESLVSSKSTASFINELIFAEDKLNCPNRFWYIWNFLYPHIKELKKRQYLYFTEEIIINYLLASDYINSDIKEWHSLKKDNFLFYNLVSKEMGDCPEVLYSIAKILNGIGSSFYNEGIDCLFSIISQNVTLNLGELEFNTMYYLEIFIRKIIESNKQKIKMEINLKTKIITILDFMVERKSNHAYWLRESII